MDATLREVLLALRSISSPSTQTSSTHSQNIPSARFTQTRGRAAVAGSEPRTSEPSSREICPTHLSFRNPSTLFRNRNRNRAMVTLVTQWTRRRRRRRRNAPDASERTARWNRCGACLGVGGGGGQVARRWSYTRLISGSRPRSRLRSFSSPRRSIRRRSHSRD
jgi:hypothetical protein